MEIELLDFGEPTADLLPIARLTVDAVRARLPGMPPMGGAKLSPDQIQAVAAYVYSLSHGSAAGTSGMKSDSGMKKKM